MSEELRKAMDAIANLPRTPKPTIPDHKHHLAPAAQTLWIDQATIMAAHPLDGNPDNHPAWDAAMILVGERHAKHDLVDLVGYLIGKGRSHAAVLEQVRNILMDQRQPHLAVRMCDALKVLDSALVAVQISSEPFVVKHYASDLRPSIKGNGFDGLEVGTIREDAEQFVTFVNARMSYAAATVVPTPREACDAVSAALAKYAAKLSASTAGCTMGEGCDEVGICFAAVNGRPDHCGKPAIYTDTFILEALNIPGLNVEASFEPRELPLLLQGIRDMLQEAKKA